MNAYTRATRECVLGDMHPDLTTAIRKHMAANQPGDIEPTLLICCETTSTNKKTGLFAKSNGTTLTGAVVTTQLLVWTNGNEKGDPVVASARLRNIDAHDFENTAMYRVNPDSGINISGRYTDVTKQGQSFIGLGTDPAGEKFRQVLQHAIQRAQS